jgi:PEP-CTERM motif-containing protein
MRENSMRKYLWVIASLLLFTAIAEPNAQADSFTFTIGGPDSGSGTLTTNALSGGSYLVTGITGTFDGSAIASLLAPGGFAGNDNLLFPTSPQLDGVGLSFQTTNGDVWNIECFSAAITPCFQPIVYVVFLDVGGIPVAQSGPFTFDATRAVTTPEPSSIGLMLVGIGFLLVMRKHIGQGLPLAT